MDRRRVSLLPGAAPGTYTPRLATELIMLIIST